MPNGKFNCAKPGYRITKRTSSSTILGMEAFSLDPQLAKDCLVLAESDTSLLLLMNNALVPWFILVPRTSETELHALDATTQAALLKEINLLASKVKTVFAVDKLNLAAIGNVVQQLHVHIIGRRHTDYCWPNVVWGRSEREPYTEVAVAELVQNLLPHLRDTFRLTQEYAE
ncbi:MAG: HIT domain-containing protein [Gammaproteobacteria bacterium]